VYGELAKQARQSAGIGSRSAAANLLGLSGEGLRRIEAEKIIPRNDVLRKMVTAYDMGEELSQRMFAAVFHERLRRNTALQEQEDLKCSIADLGLDKLSNRIAADLIRSLRRHKQLSDQELYQEVDEVVAKHLRGWEGL
jgi:transcriptional regulator with XRE-family HTH domain